MKPTFRFLFSLILVLVAAGMLAQAPKKETTPVKKDTLPVKVSRYGVRVGADLYKLSRSFYDKNYKGLEVVGDYRLTKRYYIAGELGNENKTVEDDRLSFNTKGTYFKAGFDYNLYDNWLDM